MKKLHQIYFLSMICSLALTMYAKNANTVVATMDVGVNPAGLAITPDSRTAYVANSNSYGITGQDSVSVLDLKNNLPVDMITDAGFNQPSTVTLNNTGTRAYVTNSNSTTVSIIDTDTNDVIGTITGFDGPSGMVITPAGNTAYVNNYGSPAGVGSGNGTTVSVVNLLNNTIIGQPITVGQAPAALAISPNGAFVYSINYVNGNPGTGTMSVINTATNTVTATITGFSGPFAIAITSTGRYAYVTNFGSNNFAPFGNTVSVVDLCANAIVDTIDLGIQPSGIVIPPYSCYAYVTNYNTLYRVGAPTFSGLTAGQGTVNIINLKTNEVVAPTILVGQSPANIAVAPNGKYAYVSNFTSNTVSVIQLKS